MPTNSGSPTITYIGQTLRKARLKRRLSQPEAARRAGVGTRLWSEVERGLRANVSASTILEMLEKVGLTLQITEIVDASAAPEERSLQHSAPERLDEDLARAEEYGIDLSLLREFQGLTQLERVLTNDDALEFFDGMTVIAGWLPRTRDQAPGSETK